MILIFHNIFTASLMTATLKVGYFAGFEQIKNFVVILLTLNKSKI